MTDRKRSDKDIVPKFDGGDDALAWMEGKLDGSWTDALDEPKEKASVQEPEADFGVISRGTVTGGPQPVPGVKFDPPQAPVAPTSGSLSAPKIEPEPMQYNGPPAPEIPLDMMTPEEISERINAKWKTNE